VQVALGTDSGVGEHGGNGRELALMVEGGMTPMQALVAATSVPARLIGLQDEIGTLEAGKLADVVAVQGDPLQDIALLGDPERVRMVVKGGRVVRQTAGAPQLISPAAFGASTWTD